MVVEGDEGATPSPDFPGEKVGLGSWRAGRPPDLFGWGEQYRGEKFRLLRDAIGAEADIRTFARV